MSSSVSTSRGIMSSSRISNYESPSIGDFATVTQLDAEINGNDETELLSVSWNQDYDCFAAGTSRGFRIYNCEPFKETFRRHLKSGGFKIVEMMFRCNILALVGAVANSPYPPNKVMIWDDQQSKCLSEFTYRSEIRAVKLRNDRIVVVLENMIYVYSFRELKQLHQIDTLSNPRGLCCLSHHSNTFVLACPGLCRGHVRVEHFGLNMAKSINAHDSQIACFTLTRDGLLLATASANGTLIRIFNTMDGTRLQEVRRGVDRAEIFSIAFSPNVQWLVASSDKGTVHLFSLRVRVLGVDTLTQPNAAQGSALIRQNSCASISPLVSPNTGANRCSSLSFMRGVLPKYFSSEWSFAKFRVPENIRFIVAFGSQNSLVIVGMNRSFYRCSFDPVHGGEMLQQEIDRF